MNGTEVGTLYYDLNIDDKNLNSQLTRADTKVSSLGGRFNTLGNELKKVGKTIAIGIGVATAGMVAFGVSSVKSFQDSQDKIKQLNTVLKSTAGIAGVTSDAAIELSKSLEAVTRFSDEDVLSAENLLLTFTKIGKDIFPQATETVLDMASALGEDTKSASIQLGKALQDPILGVTALRRVGVNFNAAQQQVIANLVATGKSAQAQRMILKELHTEFGGSARAAGETFAGSVAKLKNQFDDFKETVGEAIVKAITPYTQRIVDYLHNAGPQLEKNIQNLIVDFIKITGFVAKHIDVILALIVAYKSLRVVMAITGVIQGLTTAIGGTSVAMSGATAIAGGLSAGWLGLAVGATALLGFGVYKLIQHFKNSVVAMGEVQAANGRTAESYGFLGLFVDRQRKAQEDLKKAHEDVKLAQANLKQSNLELAQALKDPTKNEQQLWEIQKRNFQLTVDLTSAKNELSAANHRAAIATRQLKDAQISLKNGLMGTVDVIKSFGPAAQKSLTVVAKLSDTVGTLLQQGKTIDSIQGQATSLKKTLQGNYNDAIKLQGAVNGINLQGGNVKLQGRAAGGPVKANHAYIVGERRPELFVPKQDGTVIPEIPMTNGSGGDTNIYIDTINNRQDEDYVLRRINTNQHREGLGISPAMG